MRSVYTAAASRRSRIAATLHTDVARWITALSAADAVTLPVAPRPLLCVKQDLSSSGAEPLLAQLRRRVPFNR